MIELRRPHWILALTLAVMVHLAAYVLTYSLPGVPQTFRGGGFYDRGGDSPDAGNGVLVALGGASESAGEDLVEAEAEIDGPLLEPNRALAQGFVEGDGDPGSDTKPAEPVAAPKPTAETLAEETVDLQSEEAGPAEVIVADPSETEPAAKSPPIPERKPEPPIIQPELETFGQRFSVQGPAAPAQAPVQSNAPAKTASAAAVQGNAKAAAQPSETVVSFAQMASRVGNASGNEFGAIPRLNYEDRVLLWLKRHGTYPREAARWNVEGVVVLRFAILRDGTIRYYTLVKKSSWDLLNRAVKRMMDRSSPVPPIPRDIAEDEMVFTIPVHFTVD